MIPRRGHVISTTQVVLCIAMVAINFMSGGWHNLFRQVFTVLMVGLLVVAIGQYAVRLWKSR